MCRTTSCPICKGTTWYGCGQHIPTAMGSVTKDKWCTCQSVSGTDVGEFPPKYGDAKAAE